MHRAGTFFRRFWLFSSTSCTSSASSSSFDVRHPQGMGVGAFSFTSFTSLTSFTSSTSPSTHIPQVPKVIDLRRGVSAATAIARHNARTLRTR